MHGPVWLRRLHARYARPRPTSCSTTPARSRISRPRSTRSGPVSTHKCGQTNPPRSGEGGTGSDRVAGFLCSQVGVGDATQGRESLSLELTHPLGGDAVTLADVGQLLLPTVEQAVAGPHDVGFALVEVVDERGDQVAGLVVDDLEVGTRQRLAGDEVAQGRVAVVVDGGVETDVVAAPGQQVDRKSTRLNSSHG